MLLGVVSALGVILFYPRLYVSEAKLLMRYVLDRSAIDPVEDGNGMQSEPLTESLINSEVEILTSWDIAEQVVKAIGPEKLLPGAKGDLLKPAARIVSNGLTVSARKGSNVIFVSFKNKDPELATRVLEQLISLYFIKHLEVHRSANAFEFVSQQADRARSRLDTTETLLKRLKSDAGITSLKDGRDNLNADLAKTSQALQIASAEQAEQQARVEELKTSLAGKVSDPAQIAAPPPYAEESQQYRALLGRLDKLRQKNLELLAKYTPQNPLVTLNQNQIADLEKQRAQLESKFPALTTMLPEASPRSQQLDLLGERARLAGLDAKTNALRTRFDQLQEQARIFSDIAPQIEQLERTKEMEEANYKYFNASLEKARVDEALDPAKIPNISAVQTPSPAVKASAGLKKIVIALIGGGTALGLSVSFLIELLFNRTVKRPSEVESLLGMPPLLSIPDSGQSNQTPPWEPGHFIGPYSDAIRDRLILYFELSGMTRRPKLLGVASFSSGAGTSTLGAALAAAFSRTVAGKVLFVDINPGHPGFNSYFNGKPAASLAAALHPAQRRSMSMATNNLFLATVASPGEEGSPLSLKRLHDLLPDLKASDYDYIIFDMPPLSPISPSLTLSGLMDKVLLIIDSEKNNRDFVKRTYEELIACRANVSVIFNRVHSYSAKWLQAGV